MLDATARPAGSAKSAVAGSIFNLRCARLQCELKSCASSTPVTQQPASPAGGPNAAKPVKAFIPLLLLFTTSCILEVFPSAMGLQCYQCGQYNDGVGSITPCINLTKFHLQECPSNLNNYCIKYVSEGSIVRDCIDKCVERETWGTRYYCCTEDGCNSSETRALSLTAWIFSIALLTLRQIGSF